MLQKLGMAVQLMPHDVSTQWNSSCDMVVFAVEYHEPINILTQRRDLGLRKLLILGVCAPLIVLLDAFLVITSAVSLYG